MPTLLAQRWLSPNEVSQLEPGVRLGVGAGGDVYAAQAQGPEGAATVVALKRANPGEEAALAREARALFLAAGAGVPRLFGVGRVQGRLALALELVRGESLLPDASLAQVVEGGDSFSLARRLLLEVGTALLGLHQLGIVHGDVKPSNIVVSEEGRVVLLDLGLSHPVSEPMTGGTLAYLDPSVLAEGADADYRRADLFALALCAAEVCDVSIRGQSDTGRGSRARLPGELEPLLRPILSRPPARRPGLRWLLSELGRQSGAQMEGARLRAAYLSVRKDEVSVKARNGPLAIEVEGSCGELLRHLRDLELVLLPEVEGVTGEPQTVGEMQPQERARLLSLVCGPHLSPHSLSAESDDAVFARLQRAVTQSGFGCVPARLLHSETLQGVALAEEHDPVSLALGLSRRPVPPDVLAALSRAEHLPEELTLEGARALSRSGDVFGAREMLRRAGESPRAWLLEAELARRAGDSEQLAALLAQLTGARLPPGDAARLNALRARREIDAGRPSASAEQLADVAVHPAVDEAHALSLVLLGRGPEARPILARGLSSCDEEEQRARLFGVLGMLEHQQGRADAAETAFRRARDSAEAAGALLEEATYATGLAAAASDAGRLQHALEASERAEQIFEALDKEGGAARAVLGQVSVLLASQQTEELEQRAARGLRLAALSRDRRCAGYLHLCLADARSGESAAEAAREAWRLLRDSSAADRLRAAARLHQCGVSLAADAGGLDGEDFDGDSQADSVTELEAQADWWRARAERLQARGGATEGEVEPILRRLIALSAEASCPLTLGSGLMAARTLALEVGRAEVARTLHERAHVLARRLTEQAGVGMSFRVAAIGWVQEALTSMGEHFAPAQLTDIESLLRALNQRDGLRDLLRHALDLLLLWTGVERGMILLAAPGEKLVVRAARNLSREDLSEEQLALSRSMAERAVADGRPIMTIDAQREPGELHRSAHALKLRSILSVPLVARGEVLGVAYLDDRVRPGAFGDKELAWSQLIATVTALAVAEERDRLILRRAMRRAARAESRLAEELAHTKGELEVTARELSRARQEDFLRGDYSNIVGRGPAMTQVLQLVERVATADVPVLITGESGTGKELIARAIMGASDRRGAAFIAENCAALPEPLLESTLFGHRRGAFTGATKDQPGLFELADKGTLFLDEIGEMSLSMQAKLLRVLQDGEVRALGAARSRKVDVRLLCATHRELEQMVKQGTFREDLFYRLSVVGVGLPALRDRPEDIEPLVEHFIKRYDPHGRRSLSAAVKQKFRTLPWPGNVRQLENEVRRMLILGGRELTLADLTPALRAAPESTQPQTLRDRLNELEKQLVIEALESFRGNRTRAAEALGISRFGLQKMMQRLSVAID